MVTKDKWVAIMKAAGFNEDDMHRWHAEFEKSAPDEHQEFLEFLQAAAASGPGAATPPPIVAFLAAHPHIELICFNGGGAQKLFNARVLPGLPPRQAALARRLLPSTSPAYAAMRPQEKLALWKAVLMPG